MDNGQTIYKNGTLTHNFQQPAYKVKPLPSAMTIPGSQTITPLTNGLKCPGLDE